MMYENVLADRATCMQSRQEDGVGDVLKDEIIFLYESEPDLANLPEVLFRGVGRLVGADVVSFTEFHKSGDFRALVSVEDDPANRLRAMQAFARHKHSHPFWQHDPAFFGDRVLRDTDFFTEDEFQALPIARDVFLPSQARYIISVVLPHDDYVVAISGHRIIGRVPFGDLERDRLAIFRTHMLRSYRQAQERTLAKLKPLDRLRLAFPELTPRQLEVTSWLVQGKSNDEIADILDVGIDAVKAHIKAIYAKIGSDNRRMAAAIAHTAPPFTDLPPLWKLDLGAWSGQPPQGRLR
jgi:DNA-binding CsgD family transcriptional regulator